MKLILSAVALLFTQISFAQVYGAKEFSKDIALYKAKEFVVSNILGVTNPNDVVKFEVDPLAAASSGELTSLVYRCADKNKEGLVLGFFGDYWDETGNVSQAYSFKDLPKERALELFDRIEKTAEPNSKYLAENNGINNVLFQFDDLKILIYGSAPIKIRILWNKFDCEWDYLAFDKTKKRFLKNVK